MQNLNNNLPEKRFEFDIKEKKENVIRSLKEVEYFLNDFRRLSRYIRLYKILK